MGSEASTRDPYGILQVDRKAEQEVIEGAFKKLAHKYHPDRCVDPDAKRRMQDLNWAYGLLRDPVKRSEYDCQFKGTEAANDSPPPRASTTPPPRTREKSQSESQQGGSSLSGMWRNYTGNPFLLQQSGNVIDIKGMDGFGKIITEGQGIIKGRKIRYQGRSLTGLVGRGELTLSKDNMALEGELTWQSNIYIHPERLRLTRQ